MRNLPEFFNGLLRIAANLSAQTDSTRATAAKAGSRLARICIDVQFSALHSSFSDVRAVRGRIGPQPAGHGVRAIHDAALAKTSRALEYETWRHGRRVKVDQPLFAGHEAVRGLRPGAR